MVFEQLSYCFPCVLNYKYWIFCLFQLYIRKSAKLCKIKEIWVGEAH